MAIEYLESTFGKREVDVLIAGGILGLVLLVFCICHAEIWID